MCDLAHKRVGLASAFTQTAPSLGGVLSSLRGPDGGPALHTRVIAVAVVVGLLALASPVVVGIFDWVFSAIV